VSVPSFYSSSFIKTRDKIKKMYKYIVLIQVWCICVKILVTFTRLEGKCGNFFMAPRDPAYEVFIGTVKKIISNQNYQM
jgi:hypothetical protein